MPIMRIISTFVFVLITGIFSSTNAQSVEDELRSLCTKNGGHWAYQALRDTFSNFERCYKPVLNEVLTEIERANGAVDTALTRYCSKVETLRTCVETATDTVKSCLGPYQHKTVIEIVYNIADSVLQIGCKNPILLRTVFNSPDRHCVASKLQTVKYCATKIIVGRDHDSSHDRLTPETDPLVVLSLLKNKFNSQDCSEVRSFEQCSVKVLEECEDQGFSRILDSVYNYINHDIPCKGLPKLPRSKTLPGILSFTNPRIAVRTLCTKHGGVQAYKAFQSSWSNVRQCFASVMDEKLTKIPKTPNDMNNPIAVYCDEIETLKNCVKDFTDIIKSCLRPDQHELVDIGYKITNLVLKFACERREIFVKEDFSGRDRQCFESNLQSVKDCAYKFITNRKIAIPNYSLTESDVLLILSRLKIDFDDQTCSDLHRIVHCGVKVLKRCENKVFAETLVSIYNYVKNDIPCKDLLEISKSKASPDSVVKALILSISVMITIMSS